MTRGGNWLTLMAALAGSVFVVVASAQNAAPHAISFGRWRN
jgi:hypothetical protein